MLMQSIATVWSNFLAAAVPLYAELAGYFSTDPQMRGEKLVIPEASYADYVAALSDRPVTWDGIFEIAEAKDSSFSGSVFIRKISDFEDVWPFFPHVSNESAREWYEKAVYFAHWAQAEGVNLKEAPDASKLADADPFITMPRFAAPGAIDSWKRIFGIVQGAEGALELREYFHKRIRDAEPGPEFGWSAQQKAKEASWESHDFGNAWNIRLYLVCPTRKGGRDALPWLVCEWEEWEKYHGEANRGVVKIPSLGLLSEVFCFNKGKVEIVSVCSGCGASLGSTGVCDACNRRSVPFITTVRDGKIAEVPEEVLKILKENGALDAPSK